MKPNSYSLQSWGASAAKKELVKVPPSLSGEQQVATTKSMAKLDQGVKVIAVRHRHIKIADRSELGWHGVWWLSTRMMSW